MPTKTRGQFDLENLNHPPTSTFLKRNISACSARLESACACCCLHTWDPALSEGVSAIPNLKV